MPAAIPLIVSIAATAAGYSAIVVGVLSLAASLITNAIFVKKPKPPDLSSFLNSAGAGRTQMVRQPITPHSIPYGRSKQSGPLLFIHTKDDDEARANGYLYLNIALAGTEIQAIRDIYVNEDFSSDAKFSGLIRVSKHLGTDSQVADADLVSELPGVWDSDYRGRGIAYIAVRLKWNATAYPSGIPNIAAIVDGVKNIYDPRTLATGFTNNAALCIANWLTSPYGKNLPWAKLDEDSVIEAANICDERVRVRGYDVTFTAEADDDILTLAEGARSLDWGDGVRVSVTAGSPAGTLPTGLSADTTYYVIPILNNQIKLATSAANAFAGTAINLTADSVGSVTLTYWDEARYKLNGSYTLDTENGEVLDQLRGAMAGYVFPRGGKWFMHAGAAVVPTFTLTEDHLTGDGITVEPKRSMRDRINGVRAVYVNPDANWQPDDSPVLAPTAALLLEDNGEELYGDVRNSFVTSRTQLARLMKIDLMRNRQQMTVQALFKWHALKVAPLDTGTFTHTRYFDEAEFQVVGWALDTNGISLQLLSYASTDYDWDYLTEEPDETPRPIVVRPDPSSPSAPATFTVVTPLTATFDNLELNWDADSSIFLDGYDVQYSAADEDAWQTLGRFTVNTAQINIVGILYDFRVRSVYRSGAVSDWTYNYAPDEPTGYSQASTVLTWTSAVDADDVQIFYNDGESDILEATVPSGDETYNAADSSTRYIRSVAANGNISGLISPS